MFFKELKKCFSLIKSDLSRYYEIASIKGSKINKFKIVLETFIFKAGFNAVFLYRISHFFYKLKRIYIAWFFSRLNVSLTGAEIEFNAEIQDAFFIPHPVGIVIGRGTKIGKHVTVFQNVTFGVKSWDAITVFPEISDNVTIYSGAKILGGIKIGNNSIIGANAVVNKDVEANVAVGGIPAKIIKKLESN